MDRKQFLYSSAIVTGSALLSPAILGKMFRRDLNPIRRNTGFFTARGGTIGWLASEDALVVIDSQYPSTAPQFLEELKAMKSDPIDYLINTHHHGDHTGGNPVFKEVTKHILAHENVPGYQRKAAEARGGETLENQVYADLTYADSWSETLGDETVHLKHYGPAHTGGDSVIYFEQANVAHMGDLVFNRVYPYIDPGAGASIQNWVKVLRQVGDEFPNDTIYIFGHGNPGYGVTGSKGDVLRKADFLEALLTTAQEGIDGGLSKEEISSMEVLPGFEEYQLEGWSLTLKFNLETAFDELSNT